MCGNKLGRQIWDTYLQVFLRSLLSQMHVNNDILDTGIDGLMPLVVLLCPLRSNSKILNLSN